MVVPLRLRSEVQKCLVGSEGHGCCLLGADLSPSTDAPPRQWELFKKNTVSFQRSTVL